MVGPENTGGSPLSDYPEQEEERILGLIERMGITERFDTVRSMIKSLQQSYKELTDAHKYLSSRETEIEHALVDLSNKLQKAKREKAELEVEIQGGGGGGSPHTGSGGYSKAEEQRILGLIEKEGVNARFNTVRLAIESLLKAYEELQDAHNYLRSRVMKSKEDLQTVSTSSIK